MVGKLFTLTETEEIIFCGVEKTEFIGFYVTKGLTKKVFFVWDPTQTNPIATNMKEFSDPMSPNFAYDYKNSSILVIDPTKKTLKRISPSK